MDLTHSHYSPNVNVYDFCPVHQRTIIVENAGILTLDSIYPAIVPPTEILEYSGFPTVIPVPINALALLDTSAGIYTNAAEACNFVLVWGSDWSLQVSAGWDQGENAALDLASAFGVSQANLVIPFSTGFWDTLFTDGAFEDNGLYLALDNADGALEGGGTGNNVRVSVSYLLWETTTGKYI